MNGAASTPHRLSRHFVAVGDRQVHYRRSGSGSGPPVILLHEAPLSSRSLAGMMTVLPQSMTALAIDLPGYGGSEVLAITVPTIGDYAEAVRETLGVLGVRRCVVYGKGAGGVVAVELARRWPELVALLCLDGLRTPTDEERGELQERYSPPFERRSSGAHLVELWSRRRQESLFYPWYRRELDARLDEDVPSAAELNEDVLDCLRAGETYGALHRAEFSYNLLRSVDETRVPVTAIARRNGAAEKQLDRLAEATSANLRTRIYETDDERNALVLEAVVHEAPSTVGSLPAPKAICTVSRIQRDYVSTRHGQLHVRRVGSGGCPLVLLHASPASAAVLEPLMLELGQSRMTIAFDTLGNGESDKPTFVSPDIKDYAQVIAGALSALGLDQLDLYGTHTGALIAAELAIARPDMVRSLILDGVSLFRPDVVEDFLRNYLVPLEPRWDGSHLIWAWSMTLAGALSWPWYDSSRRGIRWVEPYGDDELHLLTVETLKSGSTYPLAYRAAFTHPTAERLPLLNVRTLLCAAGGDVLHESTQRAVALVADAEVALVSGDPGEQAAAFVQFLGSKEA
jgi:pimeloyl-ACP methyl ester carboxylesterase